MPTIKIITGSSRPGRFNIQPAEWLLAEAKKIKGLDVELVDVEKLALPFLDEAMPPMMKQYSHEHTKKWSEMVHATDGFVFVTPEYNHSYSAVLKNAIDYLFHEWNYKPVAFVSYGSMAGGARAVEHLRGVAGELKMFDLREQVLIPNYWGNLNDQGQYQFDEHQAKAAQEMLQSLAYWSEVMKTARVNLPK